MSKQTDKTNANDQIYYYKRNEIFLSREDAERAAQEKGCTILQSGSENETSEEEEDEEEEGEDKSYEEEEDEEDDDGSESD